MKNFSLLIILLFLFSCKKEQGANNDNEISLSAANTAAYTGVVVASKINLFGTGFIYVDAKSNIYALIESYRRAPYLIKVSGNDGWNTEEFEYPQIGGFYIDKNDVRYITALDGVYKYPNRYPNALLFDIIGEGFGYVTNVKTDSNCNFSIAVSEGAVFKWSPGSKKAVIVAGGNGLGSADNQLKEMRAIDFDVHGAVYTAEKESQRISKWESGASTKTTICQPIKPVFGSTPGVAVDENSNVYVIEKSESVVKFLPGATKGQMIIDQTTPGAGKDFRPSYLFCDKRGSLYISDTHNKQITKWSL